MTCNCWMRQTIRTGISINGFAFLRIKKGQAHDHAHGHTHNHNSKAIMLHLLEDVLGWVAVLIGATVIYFTNWYWIDPLMAIGIAIFIGFNATRNLAGTMKIVLQYVPENVNINSLTIELRNVEGVESIHDLHVWSMDGNYNVASLHAVVNSTSARLQADIYAAIIKLMDKHHIQHPTIQLETSLSNCRLLAC